MIPESSNDEMVQQGSQRHGGSDIACLEDEAASLRGRLAWELQQLSEIHKLYARYLELGQPFPPDLEEHSLWLILKFVRPDDAGAADRLIAVLKIQGKSIPEELLVLVARSPVPPEQMAADARRKGARKQSDTGYVTPALHDRLIFVMGLPKSASRLMVSVLAAMHPDQRFRKAAVLPYSAGDVGLDVVSDLRYYDLLECTTGGVVHSHASPTAVTRQVLARLGLSHIITVRHPADNVAALYCHIRRLARTLREKQGSWDAGSASDPAVAIETYGGNDESSYLFYHHVIFPVDVRFFMPTVQIDDAIKHIIAGGYLFHALSWIVSWQLLRVRSVSTIVRYEDFIGRPEDTLRRVNSNIFGINSEEAVLRGRGVMAEKAYETDPDPEIYPRGSTGACGIWKNYLSPSNRRLYNSVCKQFVMAHPYGSLLSKLYADLFIES